MRVLAFDTAGPVLGVAFGDRVRTERVTRGAEGRLLPYAEAIADLDEVEAVAVAIGPGAFTGVRVGLATAQGLAHALRVPLVGVGSLESRGRWASATLSLLDARKGRMYAGWAEEGFAPTDQGIEDVLEYGRAKGFLAPGFRCVGEGALVSREAIEAAGGVVVDDADHPAPEILAAIAAERLQSGLAVGPVLPVYVRPPDAVPPRRGV